MGLITVLVERAFTMSTSNQLPPEERISTANTDFVPQIPRATIPVSVDSAAREYFTATNKETKRSLEPKLQGLIFTLANMCLTSSVPDPMRKDVFRPEICRYKHITNHRAITRNATKFQDLKKKGSVIDAHKLTSIHSLAMNNRNGTARVSNVDLHFSTENNGIVRTKLKTLSADKPHYQRHAGCDKDKTISLAAQSRYSLLCIATVLASKNNTDDKRDDNCTRAAVSSIFPSKDGSSELILRLSVLDILQEALDTNELSTKENEIASLIALVENMREALVAYHHKFFYADNEDVNVEKEDGSETGLGSETKLDSTEHKETEKTSISYDKFTEKLMIVSIFNLTSLVLASCLTTTRFHSGNDSVRSPNEFI
jgi:hypothetical protein